MSTKKARRLSEKKNHRYMEYLREARIKNVHEEGFQTVRGEEPQRNQAEGIVNPVSQS